MGVLFALSSGMRKTSDKYTRTLALGWRRLLVVAALGLMSGATAGAQAPSRAHGAPLEMASTSTTSQLVTAQANRGNANPIGVGPQRETFLFEFRHPQTKEKIRLAAPHTPTAELRRFSPKNWKKRWQNPFVGDCGANHNGFVNEIIEEVPIETFGFALFTMLQSYMMSGGDPGAIKHLYEQNVEDPVAYMSIIAFVAAFQATDKFFKMSHFVFDPCKGRTPLHAYRQATNHAFGKAPPALPSANRFQKIFGPLAPGIAMGVGMGVSVAVGDFLKDKDMMLCSKGLMFKVDPVARAEACERAYEVWTVGRKLNQYFPDIFSMVSSYFISSYLAMPAAMASAKWAGQIVTAGAERYIPVLWRSLSVAWKASLFATPGAIRWGLQIGTMVVIVPIQTFLSPRLKSFWNTWQIHGDDITEADTRLRSALNRVAKQNGAWSPELKTCQRPAIKGRGGISIAKASAFDCTDYDTGLPELIRRYSQRQAEWRRFLLQMPLESHTQWQDYVLKFQNTYSASYNFNSWLIGEVAYHNKNRIEKSGRISRLFAAEPLRGVHLMTVGENGQPVSAGDQTAGEALRQAIVYIESLLADKSQRWAQTDRANLRRIANGLKFADESQPIPDEKNRNSAIGRLLSSMSGIERDSMIWQYRMLEIDRAIRLLNHILETDRNWGTKHTPYPSSLYTNLAQTNPYAAIRVLLGNPRPAPAGLEVLREFDNEATMIDQDLKENHPSMISARITTPTMTDYLLGSMVCGPEADPSAPLLLKEKRSQSVFERLPSPTWANIINTSKQIAGGRPTSDMIGLERLADDFKTPAPQWSNPNKDLTLVHQKSLIEATFYPPRLIREVGKNFCGNARPESGTNRDKPTFMVHEGVWTVDGRNYYGLLGVVKNFLRPDLFNATRTESKFDEWWARNVDPAIIRTVRMFQDSFQKDVLEGQFYPALTGDGADFYVRLGNKMNASFNGGPLALGVLPSLKAELERYLTLIENANFGPSAPKSESTLDRGTFEKKRKEIETQFGLLVNLFHRPAQAEKALVEAESILNMKHSPRIHVSPAADQIKRIEIVSQALKGTITKNLASLKSSILAGIPENEQSLLPQNRKEKKVALTVRQTRVAITLPAIEAIDGLVNETDFYLSLTKSVYLTSLYERGLADSGQVTDAAGLAEELMNEMNGAK